jgi:hypothetical protein
MRYITLKVENTLVPLTASQATNASPGCDMVNYSERCTSHAKNWQIWVLAALAHLQTRKRKSCSFSAWRTCPFIFIGLYFSSLAGDDDFSADERRLIIK